MTTAVERLVTATGARRVGSEFKALCPAHDDHTPSLSISEGDGCALVTCRTGCETSEVLDALGLGMRDLYDEPREARDPDAWVPKGHDFVDSYDYVDASGRLVFQVVRARDETGEKTFWQRRPDSGSRSGWAWNLRELSEEQRLITYRLQAVLDAIAEGREVWVVEGEKDVEALRRAGVTATCNAGGAGKWTARHASHLAGVANVTVVQDRDKAGRAHGSAVVRSLSGVAQSVRLVEAKTGKDAHDHLRAGHSLDDFVEVEVVAEMTGEAEKGAEAQPQGDEETDETEDGRAARSPSGPYEARSDGLWHVAVRTGPDGEPKIAESRLTNFTALITSATEVDDGVEIERMLEIEATVDGRKRTCAVSASTYARMEWPVPELGPRAIIAASRGAKDHARAGIQELSDPTEVRVYSQTGWREIETEGWVYLHAGGGIGADGPVDGVQVDLGGSLSAYDLPAPGGVDAIKASLRMLGVAPDRIMLPLLMAVVRAPLGGVDLAVWLYGSTGLGKSELAALGQQFFGPLFDARSLPASWSGTANSLEEMAFRACDALLTVDDYCPAGSLHDTDVLAAKADRLIRNAGNGAARGRLSREGTLRAARPPRALILSTGEEQPRGQSLRARTLPLGVTTGDVDWDALSAAQIDAANGVHAASMAAYLQWCAGRLADLRAERPVRVAELRTLAARESTHRRTASAVASLAWGWEVWLRFAVEAEALSPSDAENLRTRGWTALLNAADAADAAVGETDPARRFLTLLGSAIGSGRAHVASRTGGCPPDPSGWGWRNRDGVATDIGRRVGWTEDGDLWLDPEASYAAAQSAGDGLTVDAETLRARLCERGLLASVDTARTPPLTTVRVRVEGRRRRVLHLRADALGERDEVGHPGGTAVGHGDPSRPTVSHPWVTQVSQAKSVSDKEKQSIIEVGSPVPPETHHVTEDSGHFDGFEGPNTNSRAHLGGRAATPPVSGNPGGPPLTNARLTTESEEVAS